MNRLLLQLVLVMVPLTAFAGSAHLDASGPPQTPRFVIVSQSACNKDCEGAYTQCGKKSSKDMKQCSSDRKACYQRCAAAVTRSECKKDCDGHYIQCGKGSKDMKRCSDERKACYRKCS